MVLIKQYVATAYVYDRNIEQFLLIFHKKLGKWLAPGGHLEPGEEPHAGALRELAEETGLVGRVVNVLAVPDVSTADAAQLPAPFCLLSETIPAVGVAEEHVHLDFIYVIEIDHSQALDLAEREVSSARWFTLEDIKQIETYTNVRRICQAISECYKFVL